MRVTEKDFETLSEAAIDALQAGNAEQASRLDILARKANAELSRQCCRIPGFTHTKISWRDVPSVFEGIVKQATQ